MTTPKTKFAGLALIAALCAGFTLGLTVPAWAGWDEGWAAYDRRDYATAVREWRPLAEQGNVYAQSSLGNMYNMGRGVPQDYAEAARWYRKAAEQGYANAQYFLGFMYSSGRGVTRDDTEAVQWYRKAAEQGDAYAQYALGIKYGLGHGVPQDYVQAYMWYNLAASKFSPGEKRDEAVNNRDIVAKRMTPAQVSKSQKLAREWWPK